VTVTVSKEDTARYSPAAATEDAQKQAKETNQHNRDLYMTELKNAQKNVDASKAINGIPSKPSYITVTDPVKNDDEGGSVTAGERSEGPWPDPPGLPDLKKKIVYPSGGGAVEEDFILQ
jgi:hypothetical protein